MKLRTHKQLQTTKRLNIDTTSSTIVTPVKQRRLVHQVTDIIKNPNTIENISSNSLLTANTSTGFKTSMMVRLILFFLVLNDPCCLLLDNSRKTSIDETRYSDSNS